MEEPTLPPIFIMDRTILAILLTTPKEERDKVLKSIQSTLVRQGEVNKEPYFLTNL